MAEEHGYQQAPEGHILCANNCGFFGSPATMNLCSKCYRVIGLREEQDVLAKAALDNTQHLSGSSSCSKAGPEPSSRLKIPGPTKVVRAMVVEPAPIIVASVQPNPNRCLTCRKRVGLTGFKCRCGSMFCGSHRYPEQHECNFDYKKVGKEAIAKANPVIKADKLDKL